MTGPCGPAGQHLPLRHWDRDPGWAPNPPLLSLLTPALPPLPNPTFHPFCLQFCAENPSSRPRATMTPAPQSPGTRPPNKEPPPSFSVNTIKGPALPSESVSLAGKPGTGSGMLSHLLAVKRVTSMGVFILLQEEPGKMPQSSGLGTTQQRPRLPSLQPRQPANVLPWQPAPAWPGHQPRRTLGSRHSGLPTSHFHVLGESYPSCSHKWPSPQQGGSLGEGALRVPDSLREQNWPRGHSSSYPHQLRVHLPVCSQPGPSAREAPSQVPLPQLEEGPTCWSMAGARAHPGMKCQVLPLPVAPMHALTLSRPSEGQHGLEGASF